VKVRAIFGLCGCVSGDGFYSVYDLCEPQILSDGFSPSPVERGPDGVLDMDFHGTLTMAWYTFIGDVKDVYGSLAHHGFERVLMVNDHGLNASLLDMFARLTMLETNHSIIIRRWVGTWFAGIAR